MEKLNVVLDTDKTKTASTKAPGMCPTCGSALIENNQFLMLCPKCGTLPFEKKDK